MRQKQKRRPWQSGASNVHEPDSTDIIASESAVQRRRERWLRRRKALNPTKARVIAAIAFEWWRP